MAFFRHVLAFSVLLITACASAHITRLPADAPVLQSSSRQVVNLSELTQRRDFLVVVFWSKNCPCVRRYQARLEALQAKYPQIEFAAVVSNAGESFEEAQNEAQKRGVSIPLYWDEDGQFAQTVGARTTPTTLMFDRAGNVLFFGWIDNEHDVHDSDREPWLQQAIDRALAHTLDSPVRTTTFGCMITKSFNGSAHKSAHCNCEGMP